MKKFFAISAILISSFTMQHASAQVHLSVSIGQQRSWVLSTDHHADFYYLPEINCYYDVVKSQYIYNNNGNWRYAKSLPNQYRNVDLNKTHREVVSGSEPFRNNFNDRQKYIQDNNNRYERSGMNNNREANNNGAKNQSDRGNSEKPNYQNGDRGNSNKDNEGRKW